MKKKLILLLGILFGWCLVSCKQSTVVGTQTNYTYSDGVETLQIYYFNGHQYIGKLTGSNSDVLTHSGECTNSIHFKKLTDTTLTK